MIYTPMTKRAMKLAYRVHAGQFDKSGVPYICHPLHVAEAMKDELSTTVALLHDTIEDTYITADELRREGYSDEVVDAVVLLTRDYELPYLDYIRRLASNPVARAVKLADLTHNLDLSRLDVIDENALEHQSKYLQAMAILTGSDQAAAQ